MKIARKARNISHFFFSQAFADGFRTTVAILLPALIASYLGYFSLGLSISLGAVCVSLTDAPGPALHKRNGMLATCMFLFLVSAVTEMVRENAVLLGIEITLVSFFFSMFTVYGTRATAVGNAVILVMILTMDPPAATPSLLVDSVLITAGGFWYMGISLASNRLLPYRPAQRILGECIREIATYLSIKADFYNPSTDLQEDYKRLIAQQVIVSHKQDEVRELFFKTRQIVRESSRTSRKLVMTFVDSVDLFEDITATYYDYAELRRRFRDSGQLQKISGLISQMALELENIGASIQMNAVYTSRINFEQHLVTLRAEMDSLPAGSSNLVLKKILVNLRRLVGRLKDLHYYFREEERDGRPRPLDHDHFVSHQPLDAKVFWDNLSARSSVFKHALRVSIACLVGYLVVKGFAYGQHSYWILLTIAFIIKPAFSLTKQRNVERIIGTLIGGAIGVLILVFIPNRNVQFALLVLFMLANYSVMRINYLAMVMFTTPLILILFNFLGAGFEDVARERVLDTVIGCVIAFCASYFLFPSWESEGIREHLANMLRANWKYLQKIEEGLKGSRISMLDYKLVRKEVYVSSANLAASFQRMLSEPKTKQLNSKQVHQAVVLNHILFSNIATVATTILRRERQVYPVQLPQIVQQSERTLNHSLHLLTNENPERTHTTSVVPKEADANEDDALLHDQLHFIHKLCVDMTKTVEEMIRK
jgi:YccS/YhfK family integral membrane protein